MLILRRLDCQADGTRQRHSEAEGEIPVGISKADARAVPICLYRALFYSNRCYRKRGGLRSLARGKARRRAIFRTGVSRNGRPSAVLTPEFHRAIQRGKARVQRQVVPGKVMVVCWPPASITAPRIVAWKIFRIASPAHQVSCRYRSICGSLLQHLVKNFVTNLSDFHGRHPAPVDFTAKIREKAAISPPR